MTGNGYVLEVNGVVFPNALLAKGGYSNTPDREQDEGSFTDANGETHRQILPYTKTTIKIKTKDYLTFGQKQIVQSFFPNRSYVEANVWNDARNAYQKMKCYVPDVTYTVAHIDNQGNFYYDGIEFEFIDYGGPK